MQLETAPSLYADGPTASPGGAGNIPCLKCWGATTSVYGPVLDSLKED